MPATTGEAGLTVDASRLLRVMPGGSNGEFGLPARLTRVIEGGRGCRLVDTDGREMLDFSMGWGSVLPGHGNGRICDAVRAVLGDGTNFAYPSVHALRLAERLVELSPACERVRFAASGTEATMYCLRLGRAFAGRGKVLRFEGAYHGAHDVGVTSLFPSGQRAFPEPEPTSAGIDAGMTLVAPYNDLGTTSEVMRAHQHELGAVIVEPFQRCLSPKPGFLEGLRSLCDETGVVLIFDEVVTGFRLALGGAQAYYGVVPDLVAYGKAMGGGLPIGAFGGRAEIMDLVCEDRIGSGDYVWTASSLGGNPVSAAAANAAIDLYSEPGTYERLRSMGEHFRATIADAARAAGVTARVLGDGPLAQIVFAAHEITDYRSGLGADRALARRVMLELFDAGVFVNPMGTKLYLSLAHTEDDIGSFGRTLTEVLRRCAGG